MDLTRLLTRLLNGFANRFLRQAVSKGINAGVDYAARKGKPAAEMTPDEKDQARKGRELAKRAQQVAKLGRRFGR